MEHNIIIPVYIIYIEFLGEINLALKYSRIQFLIEFPVLLFIISKRSILIILVLLILTCFQFSFPLLFL